MGNKHDWTKAKSDVTTEKVIEITDIIIGKIKENDGSWTGTIHEIMQTAGQEDPDEYGSTLQAVDIASKLYKIQWNKAGRNGREYYINESDLAKFYAEKAKLRNVFETTLNTTIVCSHCGVPTNYTINIKENKV